jgi:hypothetical protein
MQKVCHELTKLYMAEIQCIRQEGGEKVRRGSDD